MEKKEQEPSPMELPGAYGDGDIPEIDLPSKTNATNSIPEEMPTRSTANGNKTVS